MIRFTTSLFLLLSIILIAGILFADIMASNAYTQEVFSLGLFLTIVLAVFLKGRVTTYFILTSFFFLGTLLLLDKRTERNLPEDITTVYGLGEIVEWKASMSGWNQGLLQIHGYDQNENLNYCSESVVISTREHMMPGDRLIFQLDLEQIKSKRNPGEFDVEKFYDRKNVRYHGFLGENDFRLIDHSSVSLSQLLLNVRDWAKSVVLNYIPKESQGLTLAILLGDKGYLADETVENFQDAGAMHVLAVSGLHVGIVMLLLNFLLQRVSRFVSKKSAVYLTLILTFFYAGITGFSPSVVRSFIMFGVLLIAQLNSWNSFSLNALGFAAFVLILYDPLVVYDLGFQLSFLAMIGILLFYSKVSEVLYVRNKYLRKIWQGTAVGIAAQVTTLPLVLFYFGQFANYFWLSNLLVMVFAGIILSIGLSFLFIGKVHLLAGWIGFALGGLVGMFQYLIGLISNLPFAVGKGFTPDGWTVFILYLLLLVVMITWRKRNARSVLIISILSGLILVQFQRLRNLSREELIVFNSNTPLVTYRNGGKMLVFYSDPSKVNLVNSLVGNYNRKLGCQVKYSLLKEGGLYTLGAGRSIGMDHKSRIRILVREKNYVLARSYSDLENPAGIPIKMAYLPVTEEGELSLVHGAIYLHP